MKINTKRFRMIVDILMVILLPMLMGYSLIGETTHEIIGIVMAALMITHITLNRKWFSAIFKGRYNVRRMLTTVVNLLLIICVLTSMVSGIMISKHIFTFLNIEVGVSLMRTLHLLAAYWGFVLMSFHAGTHGGMILKNIHHKWLTVLFVLISLYGIYAFIKRGFTQYMFLITQFVFLDVNDPFIFFYIDYLAVMLLFMTAGYFTIKLLNKGEKNHG